MEIGAKLVLWRYHLLNKSFICFLHLNTLSCEVWSHFLLKKSNLLNGRLKNATFLWLLVDDHLIIYTCALVRVHNCRVFYKAKRWTLGQKANGCR